MLEINLQGAPLQSGSLRFHHLPEVPKITYKVYRYEELSVKVYDLPTEPKYLKIAQDFITNEHTLRIREGETPFILNSIDLLWDTAETAQIITSYASGGSGQHLLAGWSEESNNESNAILNPLPPDFVVSVAHNLASALECMHSIKTLHTSREVKSLHLDVKPANVFFLDNTRRPPLPRSAVLANFSSARETSPPDAVTAWPADESSAKYASPEMLESNEATEKSDIWSLGATLLALLTGLELGDEIHGYKHMWNFARETGGDAYVIRSAEMRTLSRETPDWDSSWVKNLPPKALSAWEKAPLELRSLISSCLALHPANRPTAQELLNLKILKHESVLVAKYLDEVRQAEEKARQLALEEEIKKKEVGTRKRKTVNDWSELDTQIEQAFSQLAALKGQLNAFKKHQIEADPFDESAVPLRGLLDQIETSKHLMEDMIKVQGDSFQAQPRQNAIKAALAQKVSHLDAEFRKVHPSLIFEQKQYVIALRFNSYMAMWTELLQLLNGPQPMGANEIKRFKALASVLSDSLALKAERIQGSSITAATTSEVLEEYAEWRKKALLDDACMAPIPADKPPAPNVRVTLGSEKECPSLLSTHDMARGIYDRVRTLDTVLKGALAGTVTSYDLPALLTSDAVLLLHPKAESTLKYVRQLENDLTEHLEVCALRDSSMKLIEKVFNAVNLEAAITSEERDLLTFVQSVLQLVANNASQAACNSELKAGNSVTKVSSCLYLSADSSPIVSLASGLVLMQAAGDLVHKLHNDGLSQLRESPAGPPLVEQLESEAKNKEALEMEAQSKYEKALVNMETAKKAYDFALKLKIFKKEDIELRSCEVELERQKIFLKTARELSAAAKQKAVQVRVKENTFIQERVQKLQAVTSECLNEMLRILREVLDPFSSAWRLHTKSVATNELASSSSRVSASPYTDALAIVRSVYIIGDDVLFNTAMKALTLTPRQSNAVQMKARKVDVDVALHFSIFDTYSMSVQEKWEYLSKSACSALSKLDQEKTSFTVHATAALIRLQVAGSGIFRSLRTLHGVGKHFSTPEEVLEIRARQANALGLMKRMLTTTKNLFKAALFHPPIPLEEEVLDASHQVAQVRSDLRSLRSEMYRYGDSAVLAVLSCDEYCGSAQLACLKYVSTVTPTGLKLKTELEAITKELHDRVEPDLLSNDEIKLTAAAMDLSNRLELAATSLRDLALKTAQVSTFSPHVVFTDARIALTSHLKPTLLVSRLAHVLWTSLLHPLADLVIHQRLQLPDASLHAMVNVFSALEPVLMSRLTAMSPENILALFDSDADSLNSLNTLPMSLRQLQIGFKEVHQSGPLISIATVLSAACEELLKQVMRLSVSKLRRTYESQVEAGKTQPLPKLLICHDSRGSRLSDPKIDQSAVKVADLLNNTLLQRTVRDQATKERIDDKEAAEFLLDIEAEVWRAQVIHGAVLETFDSMLGLQDCAMDFSSSANIGGRFLRLVKKTSFCMLKSLKESKESLPHLIQGLFTLENTVLTQDVASGLWIAAKKEEESLKIVFDSLLRDTEEIRNTAKKLTEEAEAELQYRLSFYEKSIAQSQENEEKSELEHKARQDHLKAIYENDIYRYNSSVKQAQDSFNDWHQHLHSACGSFANASTVAIKYLCEHASAYEEESRLRRFPIKELDSKVFLGKGEVIRIDFSEGIVKKNGTFEGYVFGVWDSIRGTKPPDNFFIFSPDFDTKSEVSLNEKFVDLPLSEYRKGFHVGSHSMRIFISIPPKARKLGVPLNKTYTIEVTVSIHNKFVFKSPEPTSAGINASSGLLAPFDFSRYYKELDQKKYVYFACREKVYDKPSPFVEAPFKKKHDSSFFENFKSQVIKGINQELEDWRKSTPGKSILSLYSESQKVMNSDIPDIQRGMSDAICHNKSQNFILDVKKVGQLPQSISDMRVSVSRIMTNVRIKSSSHFEWSLFQNRPPLTESWTINMGKLAENIVAIFTRMEKSIPKIRLIAAHLGYISASLCVISPIADLRTVAEDTDLAQNLLVSAKSSSESHESMNVDTVVESLRFEGMQRLLDTLVLRRKDQFAKQSSIIKLVSMLPKDDIVPADALPSTQIASFRCTMKSGKVSLISDMDCTLSFGAILEGDLTVQEQQVLLYNETDMHCNISLSINHGKGSWGVFSVSSSIVPLSPSESIFIHISARPQANAGVLRATLLASIDKVPDKIATKLELAIEKIDIRISTGASDVLDFGNMVIDATKVHSRPFRIFNGNSCPVRLKLGMQYLMGQKTGISLIGNDVREIAPQNVETVTVNVSPNKVADDFNGMGVLIAVGKPKPFFHRISVSGQVFAPKFTISSPTQGTCTPQSPVNMGTIENIGSSLSTTFLINNLINFEYEVAFSCTSATANNGVDCTTAFSVLPSKILLPISRGEEDEGVPITVAFDSSRLKDAIRRVECILSASVAQTSINLRLQCSMVVPHLIVTCDTLEERLDLSRRAKEYKPIIPIRKFILENKGEAVTVLSIKSLGPYIIQSGESAWSMSPQSSKSVTLLCDLQRADYDREGEIILAGVSKVYAFPYKIVVDGPDVCMQNGSSRRVELGYLDADPITHVFRLINNGNKTANLFLSAGPSNGVFKSTIEFYGPGDDVKKYPVDGPLSSTSEKDVIDSLALESKYRQQLEPLSIVIPESKSVEIKVTLQRNSDLRVTQRMITQRISVIVAEQAEPLTDASVGGPKVIRLSANAVVRGSLFSNNSTAPSIDSVRTMTSGLFPLLADWLARPSTLSECASLDYIYLAILPLLQEENTSTIDAFVTTLSKDKFEDGVLGEASIEAAKDLCKACNTFTLDSLCDHLVRCQSSLQESIVSTKPAIVEQVIDVLLDSCVDSDYLQQLFLLHCRLVTYDIDEVATFVSASSSNNVSRFVSESLKDLKRPQRFNFFNNNVEHLAPVVVSLVQGLHFGKDVSTETDAQDDVTSLCGFIAALGKKDLFAILDAASRHLSQPLLQALGAMQNYSNNQRILAWIALEAVAIEFSLINPSPAFIVEAFRSLVGFSDADGASHLLHSLYRSRLCNDSIGTAVFFAEKAVRCFKSSAPINLPPLLEVFRPRSVAKRNTEALELKELPSFIVSILPENAQGLRSSVLLDSKMSPAIRAAAILLDVHFIARNELNSDSSPVQVVIDVIQLAGESETGKLETLLSHMSSDSRERLQLLAQLVYEGAPLASILRSARNVIIKEANFLKTKEAADAASKCGSALDSSSPFTIATSFVDFAGLISPDWARTPQSKLITLLGKLKSHPSALASLEYVDCACKAFGADADLKRMIQKLRMFMEDNSPNVADLYKAVLPEQMALLATDFFDKIKESRSIFELLIAFGTGSSDELCPPALNKILTFAIDLEKHIKDTCESPVFLRKGLQLLLDLHPSAKQVVLQAQSVLAVVSAIGRNNEVVERVALSATAIMLKHFGKAVERVLIDLDLPDPEIAHATLRDKMQTVSSGLLDKLLRCNATKETYIFRDDDSSYTSNRLNSSTSPIRLFPKALGSKPNVDKNRWFRVLDQNEKITSAPEPCSISVGTSVPGDFTESPTLHSVNIESLALNWKTYSENSQQYHEMVVEGAGVDTVGVQHDKFICAIPHLRRLVGRWSSLFVPSAYASASFRRMSQPESVSNLNVCATFAIFEALKLARSIRICQEGLSSTLTKSGRLILSDDLKLLVKAMQGTEIAKLPPSLKEALLELLRWSALNEVNTDNIELPTLGNEQPISNLASEGADPFAHLRVPIKHTDAPLIAHTPADAIDVIDIVEQDTVHTALTPEGYFGGSDIPSVISVNYDEFSWKEVTKDKQKRDVHGSGNRNAVNRQPFSGTLKLIKRSNSGGSTPSPTAASGSGSTSMGFDEAEVEIESGVAGEQFEFKQPPLTAADIRTMIRERGLNLRELTSSSGTYSNSTTAMRDQGLDSLSVQKVDHYTYGMLANSKAMAKLVKQVLLGDKEHSGILQELAKLSVAIGNSGIDHIMEWTLILDNSGSMSLYESYVLEAIALTLEVLKKSEVRLAVVKIGEAKREVLLKDMSTPVTSINGQLIFDRMTFNERSDLAHGVEAAVKSVWGEEIEEAVASTHNTGQRPVKRHHLVLMITDALSGQFSTDAAPLRKIIEDYKLQMGILAITVSSSDAFIKMLRTMTGPDTLATVSSDHPYEISTQMGGLLLSMLKRMHALIEINSRFGGAKGYVGSDDSILPVASLHTEAVTMHSEHFVSPLLPLLGGKSFFPINEAVKQSSSITESLKHSTGKLPDVMFRVSASTSSFPESLLVGASTIDSQAAARKEAYKQSIATLGEYTAAAPADEVRRANELWDSAAALLNAEIASLTTVFEEAVFTFNRFTRRRAAVKGSSLFLPGLIKAIVTDFNFKKFFATRSAGGRRQYSVALVVDTSASMAGISESSMASSLVMIISSLIATGIENFSIFTFDDRVRVVKLASQPWDTVAQATLLAQLRSDIGYRTMDAAAIDMAVQQLLDGGVRGPKRVYVLTDGFSHDVMGLTHSLYRAERAGVEVVGVGVGTDMVITDRVYQHWINAALPSALPDAFGEFYGRQDDAIIDSDSGNPTDFVAQNIAAGGVSELDVASIIASRSSVFRDISDELQKERQATLTSGGSSTIGIDIAFVLDVTGSMAPVLHAIKTEIANIARAIRPELKETLPNANLLMRLALVPYRDYGDPIPAVLHFMAPPSGNLTSEILDEYFETQAKTLTATLHNLRAEGGADLAEDVSGALKRTVSLAWHPGSKVRYAILITDAPPHGVNFHSPDISDSYPNENLGTVITDLVKAHVELVICHIDKPATAKMAQEISLSVVQASRANPGCIPDGPMLQLDLCDPKAQSAKLGGIHAIFVLDESGSMQNDYPGVLLAYQRFISIRKGANQGMSNDLISIVTFNSSAVIVSEAAPVMSAPTSLPQIRGGGTDFGPAMQTALDILNRDLSVPRRLNLNPVVIFMSDGEGGEGVTQIKEMVTRHHTRGLSLHVLAFGAANQALLQKHATAATTIDGVSLGTFHVTPDITTLASAFEVISRTTQGASGLIKHIASEVGKALTKRIALDHL